MVLLLLLMAFFLGCGNGDVLAAEILFGGDVTLARNISPSQRTFFTDRARERIGKADLFVWNMEGSGKSRNTLDKRFVFSSDVGNVEGMRFANGVATIANNHSFDGREEGLRDLVATLDRNGIPHVGLADGRHVMVEIGGEPWHVLAFTPMAKSAGGRVADFGDVAEIMKGLKGRVIVNVHDGVEGTTRISGRQREYVERLAALGADIVNFTHSHTYVDPSVEDGTLVLWGTGNFIFGGNSGWRNRNDVRMVSVNPETREWKWVKGRTRDYVFDIE